MTSLTPRRPRRESFRRKAVQKVSASDGPISISRTSRRPSLLTPTMTVTLIGGLFESGWCQQPDLTGDPAQPLARYGAPDGALAHGCAAAELHHQLRRGPQMPTKGCTEGRPILNAGWSLVSCAIRDQSEAGAKLRLPAPTSLPNNFGLLCVTKGMLYQVELMWRHGDDLGVAFVGQPRRAPPRKW